MLPDIQEWHFRARPLPTTKHLDVQAGCHFEEVHEMLETVRLSAKLAPETADAYVKSIIVGVKWIADGLKSGALTMDITNRAEFLDALADQIVTAVGVGHCAGLNVAEACRRVDVSNWSKFDEYSNPIFTEAGKIAKGPNYQKVDLSDLC